MIVYLVAALALDLRQMVRRHRARPPAVWTHRLELPVGWPVESPDAEFDFHLEPHDATSREVLATRPAGVVA